MEFLFQVLGLDEIQAAILSVKLKFLDEWNNKRREIAKIYFSNLKSIECIKQNDYGESCFHLFVIKSNNRDNLLYYLKENNINSLIHYPIPINKQKAFSWQKKEIFSNSEEFSNSVISLPIYPELSDDEINYIIKVVNKYGK
ncbi:MAG: DegT/DnrJ/EryC1/StrS family aminotransferase [Bacteroidetes bacterium]|nr:DegT/DnrJ/EryC1/StrS family aminotransferase [Bacteroidota bacterium]